MKTGSNATLGALCLALTVACSDEETHRLAPQQLGMTADLTPSYDDGELQLYEVRMPVQLPIKRFSRAQRQKLSGRAPPFPRHPWITSSDVEVQVTFTLANLDPDPHDVEVLIDPWNEFGRYWPGLQVVDQQNGEALPNLSGIDVRYEVPALKNKRNQSSRISGTFTFDDMEELARDFATVINIIENGVGGQPAEGQDDPRIAYVNHTFDVHNRQTRTPLTDRFRPDIIPGLVGFDVGLRTTEPANIAIEVFIELVDHGGNRVVPAGENDPVMPEPDRFYTLSAN